MPSNIEVMAGGSCLRARHTSSLDSRIRLRSHFGARVARGATRPCYLHFVLTLPRGCFDGCPVALHSNEICQGAPPSEKKNMQHEKAVEGHLPLGKAKSIGKPKENASFSTRESYAISAPAEGDLPLGKAKSIGKPRKM